MNHLYLIRHGENLANITLEFSHHKVDYPLTPRGILQAEQTAEALRNLKIDAIYTSPLKRAAETAQIIAAPHHLPVTPMEAFREVNVGDLEGQKPTAALWKLHNSVLEAWHNGHPETCFPGGENYLMVSKRARDGFAEILAGKAEQNIIVVGHGGIFSAAIRGLCDPFNASIMEGGMPNCSITDIEAGMVDGKVSARLLVFASKDHLSGEAAKLSPGMPAEGDLE